MSPRIARITGFCLSLALAAACSAQTGANRFYVAGSLGATQANGDYAGQVRSAGEPAVGYTFRSAGKEGGSDVGGRLAIGYQFMPNAAVELGYANFGSHGTNFRFEKTSGLIPPQPFFTSKGNFKLDGVTLDVVGTVPLNNAFSFNARVGVIASNLRYSDATTFPQTADSTFSY
ncbi:MAG: hypothetical protein ACRDAM_07780, partial [Casimicrobium sp.]